MLIISNTFLFLIFFIIYIHNAYLWNGKLGVHNQTNRMSGFPDEIFLSFLVIELYILSGAY